MSDNERSSIGPNSAAWPTSPLWNARSDAERPSRNKAHAVSKAQSAVQPINSKTAAAGYRAAIAKAEADGVAKADMVLRLTLKNHANLKRDSSVGVHEISFAGGEMQFLGVRVIAGGVDAASLELTSTPSEAAAAAAAD